MDICCPLNSFGVCRCPLGALLSCRCRVAMEVWWYVRIIDPDLDFCRF